MSEINVAWIGTARDASGGAVVVKATATYREDDPLVVSVCFSEASGGVTWDIGRDLFIEAAREAPEGAGEGDVMVSYCAKHYVRIVLGRAGNRVGVLFPEAVVEKFIDQTLKLVPSGTENAGVDLAIEKILEGA